MKKARIAIIGGTGFEDLFEEIEQQTVKTPFGIPPSLFVGKVEDREFIFLSRHCSDHSAPPHKINYRANTYALHKMGVQRILATNAVGGINADLEPGHVVIPHDFIDFTKQRPTTFYDKAPVTHVDVSQPYCPELRKLLARISKGRGLRVWDRGILVCTEGPRYETPAEIEMFRHLGCDIVGMTGFPEAVLARELEMCYASICYVSNKAAGMQERLTPREISEVSEAILPKIKEVLISAVKSLRPERTRDCICAHAMRDARFK